MNKDLIKKKKLARQEEKKKSEKEEQDRQNRTPYSLRSNPFNALTQDVEHIFSYFVQLRLITSFERNKTLSPLTILSYTILLPCSEKINFVLSFSPRESEDVFAFSEYQRSNKVQLVIKKMQVTYEILRTKLQIHIYKNKGFELEPLAVEVIQNYMLTHADTPIQWVMQGTDYDNTHRMGDVIIGWKLKNGLIIIILIDIKSTQKAFEEGVARRQKIGFADTGHPFLTSKHELTNKQITFMSRLLNFCRDLAEKRTY